MYRIGFDLVTCSVGTRRSYASVVVLGSQDFVENLFLLLAKVDVLLLLLLAVFHTLAQPGLMGTRGQKLHERNKLDKDAQTTNKRRPDDPLHNRQKRSTSISNFILSPSPLFIIDNISKPGRLYNFQDSSFFPPTTAGLMRAAASKVQRVYS